MCESQAIKEYDNLLRSKNDHLNYKLKILQNGLKILFISDPETTKSSACMAVNIGSLIDDEIPGLAHFCEHLITMGSEKYPNEGEYETFLADNGGDSNAYTSNDRTVYHFDISNDGFEGALDRFAQFFISPKFSPGSVEREINAINSEFSKNLNNDAWRLNQIQISDINPKSVFNKFSTGNKETLTRRPDIREKLIEMYKKYYTSELMNLTVYSKKPMNELVPFVENLFNKVPKIENFTHPRYDEVPLYDENNKKLFYKIVPIEDSDDLTFTWYLPFCKNYYARPIDYLASVLGHEGPNTLTSSLRRDNLLNSLCAGGDEDSQTLLKFDITISLTKKGKENYKEVILRTLKYIRTIQEIGVNERYFNEIKTISQLRFDYQNKASPVSYCQSYSSRLIDYKPEDVLVGESIYREYNEKLIKEYLDLLTLDNLNIFYSSKSLENECNLTEKWYGTKYSKEKIKITQEEINAYKCDHIFDYPPVNEFCPKNLDILDSGEEDIKYPKQIFENNKNCEVWYLQDKIFKVPKAYIAAQFLIPKDLCNNSILKNKVLALILSEIIDDELGELVYMACEAFVNFTIGLSQNSLIITIYGFNDSLKDSLSKILNEIKNINLSEEKYKEKVDIKIKEYIKGLNNLFLGRSDSVNRSYLSTLMNDSSITPHTPLYFLNSTKITTDDLMEFKNKMLENTKIKFLIQGNISKDTALDIVKTCFELFKIDINKEIINNFDSKRAVKIKPNFNLIYRFKNPNVEERDSSIVRLYQFGHLNDMEIQYLKIIHSFLEDDFFDQLRTKETLGYIVCLTLYEINEVLGMLCIIQSSVQTPEFCGERISRFFKESKKVVHEMTDEVFKNIVNSKIASASKKFNSLNEHFLYNWGEIGSKTYQFDRKLKTVEFLKKCEKSEVIKFFDKYFIDEPAILDCEYVCEKQYEENEKKMKEKKIEEGDNIKKRIIFDTIEDFRACNELFPDYVNSHKILFDE